MNNQKLECILEEKLQNGEVNYVNDDEKHIFFRDNLMDIRVTKEIRQDRHKIDIKESSTSEDYGFYSVVLNAFIK